MSAHDLVGGGVVVRHGARTVLDGVDVRLRPGELVLLCGRNGAGKSTLLRVLLGAQRPSAGNVELHGRALDAWAPRERARALAFVPQAADCPFEFTGRELVAMGRHPHRERLAAATAADRDAVEAALTAVDAAPFADRPVTTLSGGELRRIVVARALATAAPLLLLDEPLTNLDLEHALQLIALLRRLAAQGRGLLVASHDLNLLAPAADRVVLLHEGRVHGDGPPEQVLAAANLATVFGVEARSPDGYFPRAFRPLER
ncbi:MAG: ABC transporter ATP-binding protein [Planctomycetota bacterium]